MMKSHNYMCTLNAKSCLVEILNNIKAPKKCGLDIQGIVGFDVLCHIVLCTCILSHINYVVLSGNSHKSGSKCKIRSHHNEDVIFLIVCVKPEDTKLNRFLVLTSFEQVCELF